MIQHEDIILPLIFSIKFLKINKLSLYLLQKITSYLPPYCGFAVKYNLTISVECGKFICNKTPCYYTPTISNIRDAKKNITECLDEEFAQDRTKKFKNNDTYTWYITTCEKHDAENCVVLKHYCAKIEENKRKPIDFLIDVETENKKSIKRKIKREKRKIERDKRIIERKKREKREKIERRTMIIIKRIGIRRRRKRKKKGFIFFQKK